MKKFDDDPDWLRVKNDLERKNELADANYSVKRNIEYIETTRFATSGTPLD